MIDISTRPGHARCRAGGSPTPHSAPAKCDGVRRGDDPIPPTVTDDMSGALLEELGAPALVELTARIASMNMGARLNVELGIHSQEFSASCGLQPLATPSSVPELSVA